MILITFDKYDICQGSLFDLISEDNLMLAKSLLNGIIVFIGSLCFGCNFGHFHVFAHKINLYGEQRNYRVLSIVRITMLHVWIYLISLFTNEAFALSILLVQIFYIIRRKRFQGRKQKISLLVVLSLISYVFYALLEQPRYIYYLQEYFFSLYQIYLLYYFGLKACTQKAVIQLYYVMMVIFNSSILLYVCIVNDGLNCGGKVFTILRGIQLMSQLIFAAIVNKLSQKINDLNSTIVLFDKSQSEIYKQSFYRMKPLKLLTYINVTSAFLLCALNFVYYSTNSCQLNADLGENTNLILRNIIELTTYMVPLFITSILFIPNTHRRTVKDTYSDVDIQNTGFFRDLGYQ